MREPLASRLASLIQARLNCIRGNNCEWIGKHEEAVLALVREHMPSGSGFDSGTKLDLDASTADKLVFHTSFHHMNETGMYDGWTEHRVIARPSFLYGVHLSISGRDRNQIKDYIHDCFYNALTA